MKTRRSNERGHANHEWLDTHHSFSFGDYYDPQWMGFHSLRVINDDIILPNKGFATHPHRDMEIITYVISGQLEHKDSMGNGRKIQAGEVQYMAAGTGVQHSEFNPSADEAVHLLQIWIQPETKGVAPRYAEKSYADVSSGSWNLVTSQDGRDDSIAINQDADLWLARIDAGQNLPFQLKEGRNAWLHVADGEAVLNGQNLKAGDAAYFTKAETIELEATEETQILLFDLS